MADASQLTQLFQNLIGNAIKFRRFVPPHVQIGVELRDGEWQVEAIDLQKKGKYAIEPHPDLILLDLNLPKKTKTRCRHRLSQSQF